MSLLVNCVLKNCCVTAQVIVSNLAIFLQILASRRKMKTKKIRNQAAMKMSVQADQVFHTVVAKHPSYDSS